MRVISKRRLIEFWELPNRQDAEEPLEAWYRKAKRSEWKSIGEVKPTYASASGVAKNGVVSNIHGNRDRLIVKVDYAAGILLIRFIGTHAHDDQVDASTI